MARTRQPSHIRLELVPPDPDLEWDIEDFIPRVPRPHGGEGEPLPSEYLPQYWPPYAIWTARSQPMWDWLTDLGNTAYDAFSDAWSWLSGPAWNQVQSGLGSVWNWAKANPALALGVGSVGLQAIGQYQAQQAMNEALHRQEQQRRAMQAEYTQTMNQPLNYEQFLPPMDVMRQAINPFIQERTGGATGAQPAAMFLQEMQRQYIPVAQQQALAARQQALNTIAAKYGLPVTRPEFAPYGGLAGSLMGVAGLFQQQRLADQMRAAREREWQRLEERDRRFWDLLTRGQGGTSMGMPQQPAGTGPLWNDLYQNWGYL